MRGRVRRRLRGKVRRRVRRRVKGRVRGRVRGKETIFLPQDPLYPGKQTWSYNKHHHHMRKAYNSKTVLVK